MEWYTQNVGLVGPEYGREMDASCCRQVSSYPSLGLYRGPSHAFLFPYPYFDHGLCKEPYEVLHFHSSNQLEHHQVCFRLEFEVLQGI
jgi:hypothetical protein